MLSVSAAMTGLELKLRRVALRIKVQDLAERMGVSASRISAIENQAVVTDETIRRYLDALTTSATIPTSQATA